MAGITLAVPNAIRRAWSEVQWSMVSSDRSVSLSPFFNLLPTIPLERRSKMGWDGLVVGFQTIGLLLTLATDALQSTEYLLVVLCSNIVILGLDQSVLC
jgi:hypothetical protein